MCDGIAVLRAPVLDDLSFYPFFFQQDGLSPTKVGVGGCDVLQALVITPMIVVLDEGLDVSFEVAWQIVILEQDAVLQGLMPALDLALGLRMALSEQSFLSTEGASRSVLG